MIREVLAGSARGVGMGLPRTVLLEDVLVRCPGRLAGEPPVRW